ncbi:hypothetical protein [Halolamina salifodinae]|uniref:Uncharacterized protein n=1 Tax=Halolamina salifodinae TaxID=1202767 RepID=A0A8T4H1C9_9EURY|nr:hypothetical protein [Halolamina salifodinae]MBP1987594.1 hypothetical protein [Halolamina salifodinae]
MTVGEGSVTTVAAAVTDTVLSFDAAADLTGWNGAAVEHGGAEITGGEFA